MIWFPELGYSLWKDEHCFETRKEAKNKLIKDLKERRTDLDKKIKELVGLDEFF